MKSRSTSFTMALFTLLFHIMIIYINADHCVDSKLKFKVGKKKKRKCKRWIKFCPKNKKVQRLCPVTCDLKCDSECNCEIKHPQPKCRIIAELSFNAFEEPNYGYHADYITVSKDGEDEKCGWDNVKTSWGCIHKGDAYILDYGHDRYVDEKATIKIPDATNGKFNFDVMHYYTYYDKEFDEDHKNPAEFSIKINGQKKGIFSHPKNEDQETHNSDGTKNENYEGTVSVTVECTDKCECVIVEENKNNEH